MQFNNKGINISEDITGFLSIGLVAPPRPWDRQKSPPLVGLNVVLPRTVKNVSWCEITLLPPHLIRHMYQNDLSLKYINTPIFIIRVQLSWSSLVILG